MCDIGKEMQFQMVQLLGLLFLNAADAHSLT